MEGKSSGNIPIRRLSKKKPNDKPKRPLSSYNFFFKTERKKILEKVGLFEELEKRENKADSGEDELPAPKIQNNPEDEDYLDEETLGRLRKEGGKVSFEEMGKVIGQRWKNIDPDRLQKFSELAAEDTERYKKEMQSYNAKQEQKMKTEAMKPTPAYAEMHMKTNLGAAGGYGDPSMGYGFPAMGYYGHPDSFQYAGMSMYPYGYAGSDSMQQQQMSMQPPPQQDGRSVPPYSHNVQGAYGVPMSYQGGYG
jgi:hypothetical protein